MAESSRSKTPISPGFRLLLVIIAVLVLLNAVSKLQKANDNRSSIVPTTVITPPPQDFESQRVTLEGVVICLPHKNTSGPQTLECAFGIETTDKKNYALDTNLLSSTPIDLPFGKRIRATGILTPIERLSTDMWQKYDVQGIFSVTETFEVL